MKIAIDIGGTSTRIAKVIDNKISDLEVFATNAKDFNDTFVTLKKYINKVNDTIELIGICMPGPLDVKNGIVLETPNLKGWKDIKIKELFEQEFKVKVMLENDANVAALGQTVIRKTDNLLYFTVSTGIGSGFVINNKIFTGFSNTACEVANANPQLTSNNDKERTGIEYFASGINIPKQLQKLGLDVKDAREAFEILNSNSNQIVNDFFKEYANRFVQFISTAIYFLNPKIIVLGGSVVENNKEFFEKMWPRIWEVTDDIKYKTQFEFAKDLLDATLLGCVNQ
ncbi:ROK family protein [Spiroplasma culicicola]|uniref:Glucokinase n=1 Tax=Spiroplasma culicicola AES-1 TaxID=1276246 RepID=W6AFR9_9MOLU|nr:ROK family protein [Spiroplasma culicicola]AHI52554.1 glucokinase [Spiroplasma culicicola AES-1]